MAKIAVPVLIVSGTEDYYYPTEYVREMGGRIPKATVKLYEGKGHNLLSDERFAQDVADFVGGDRAD